MFFAFLHALKNSLGTTLCGPIFFLLSTLLQIVKVLTFFFCKINKRGDEKNPENALGVRWDLEVLPNSSQGCCLTPFQIIGE